MIGPSAFFTLDTENYIFMGSDQIELIHTSENGFNELYRCNKNGRFIIYKVLKKEYRGKPLYEQLLKKEFNIGISLSHVGIHQYFGFTNIPSLGNSIVMEWIEGKTLECRIKEGSIDKELSKKIICELCDALEHIHKKQVIHRDLKPENIMITDNGNNVKIIDFGLADADSYNVLKAPAGTRYYASPELLAGEPIDARSDLWSLGLIINELTKRYRFVSARCLRRNKELRYHTADEVKKAILTDGTRRLKGLIVLLTIVVGAVVGYIFLNNHEEVKTAPQVQEVTEIKAEQEVPVQEEVRTVEEAKQKPQNTKKSEEKPSDSDDINAAELYQLFNDAALSIL